MFKKYFSRVALFISFFLATPLHAAHYIAQGEHINDSKATSSRQNSSLIPNSYAPEESKPQMKYKAKPEDLEKERKYLAQALKSISMSNILVKNIPKQR